jgi:hypothetical protein
VGAPLLVSGFAQQLLSRHRGKSAQGKQFSNTFGLTKDSATHHEAPMLAPRRPSSAMWSYLIGHCGRA